jgi:hypothetical protein
VRVDVRETEARPAVTLGVPHGATAETAAEQLRAAFAGYTFETHIVIDTGPECGRAMLTAARSTTP